ncbi:MAG: hypothetical protein ABII10_02995, partial [Candidatus Paceibacterota bacterium]
TQIKVTLPRQLLIPIKKRADKYGLSLSAYIKHLVFNDVRSLEKQLESMDLPTHQMSDETEKTMEQARKEYLQGKTKSYRS